TITASRIGVSSLRAPGPAHLPHAPLVHERVVALVQGPAGVAAVPGERGPTRTGDGRGGGGRAPVHGRADAPRARVREAGRCRPGWARPDHGPRSSPGGG